MSQASLQGRCSKLYWQFNQDTLIGRVTGYRSAGNKGYKSQFWFQFLQLLVWNVSVGGWRRQSTQSPPWADLRLHRRLERTGAVCITLLCYVSVRGWRRQSTQSPPWTDFRLHRRLERTGAVSVSNAESLCPVHGNTGEVDIQRSHLWSIPRGECISITFQ